MTEQEIINKNNLANSHNPLGSNPNPTFATAQSNVINSVSMAPVANPIDLASTIVNPTDNGNGVVAGASAYATQTQNTLAADMQAYNDLNKSNSGSLTDIYKSLGLDVNPDAGKGAAQLAAEQASGGVNDLTKQKTDANSKLASMIAARDKQITDAEIQAGKTGQTWNMFLGTQGAINRGSAADIAIQQAEVQRLSGDLTAAQASTNRAIDLQYADRESAYQTQLNQYNAIKDQLTGEDKKRGDALAYALEKQKTALADQKATETSIQNIAIEVAKNGGDSSKVTGAKTVEEAIKLAGTSLATSQNEFVKLSNGDTVLVEKRTGKVIKNLGGGTGGSGTTTPGVVVTGVQTPTGFKATTGYSLVAGDDPYTIAQQNGTDMETLKKLNPNITDWTKLPVGATINLPNKQDTWLNGKTQTQIQAYNSVPDDMKASIQQLVNGDALLTDIVKSRGANTQAQINKIISYATSIDPNFSVNTNKQRYAYKVAFNNPNGKEQLQINAINTGLGHLAEFKTASDALGNSVILPYNKLVNYLKTNTGDPKVAQLNTVITALAGELAAVYKGGTAPTDQETEQWRNTILASFSTSQASGVASTTANLISNKMLSLNNSYKNVMGSFPETQIINADVINQLVSSGVDTSSILSRLKEQGYDAPNIDNATLSPYGLGGSQVNNILNQFGL